MNTTTDELKNILEKHVLWIRGDKHGVRADLHEANLSGADLRGAILSGADLYGAKCEYTVGLPRERVFYWF